MSRTDVQDILLVAFGGPTKGCCGRVTPCPGEAHCFVSGIFGHNPSRRARVDEVADHYRHFGGYSEFNPHTLAQAQALETELARRGHHLRVRCGFQHWNPYIRDTIADMKRAHVESFIILIMTPHQSSVSWDLYLRIVGEGIDLAGDGAPQVAGVVEAWWTHPGFIDALANRLRECARNKGVSVGDRRTGILLTAHSVPAPIAKTSPYCAQVEQTAKALSDKLGVRDAVVAYQSQPTEGSIEWCGPTIAAAVERLAGAGKTTILASAIGFLCDNVEVLYDLGVEGERCAKSHKISFARAESVHTHPAFIAMLADRIEAALATSMSGQK